MCWKIIFLVILSLSYSLLSSSNNLIYIIEKEWVKLIVNEDGSITLIYNLTIRVERGIIKRYVRIGMPCKHFEVIDAYELENREKLAYEKVIRGNYYAVTLYLKNPISEGTHRTFILVTKIYNFIYEDKTNVNYAGFLFIPCWWDVQILSLRILVLLPPNVKANEFRCIPNYHNIYEVNGRIALFWDFGRVAANNKISIGVSFPKKYVENIVKIEKEKHEIFPIEEYIIPIAFFSFIITLMIVMALKISTLKKEIYESPMLFIEALGPRKGLTAIEAAYLIMEVEGKIDYRRLLTMILYSLLKKGVVKIVSLNPLKIRVIDKEKIELRYYEKSFIKCIDEEGFLNEDCLINVIKVLAHGVHNLIRGYSRIQTVNYYRSIVERAWKEVLEAQVPEIKIEKFNNNLEWLLIDRKFEKKVKEYFIPGYVISRPYLSYPWYVNFIEPVYYRGKVERINIVDLADKIASSIEVISSNIVRNIEKFSQKVARIIEGRGKTSRPIIGTCICACVSCACVCACVSCACACASGGVG